MMTDKQRLAFEVRWLSKVATRLRRMCAFCSPFAATSAEQTMDSLWFVVADPLLCT